MNQLTKISFVFLLTHNIIAYAVGSLTNNGSVPVNVVMYSNYVAPTNTVSAKGRLNTQGIVIPAGQNINFLPGTSSIDVYYGNGNVAGIHAAINGNFSYTISPGDRSWVITQDQQ